jgi:cytoskeleton protein RodZ
MTDQSQEQTGTSGFSTSTLSLDAVGRILMEAREKMGLSIEDVGTRLRLTPKQVEAMEAGRMDELPGPAFVRGFLRNYAKLLQVDPEPLVEACRTHGVELPPKYISLHSENIQIAGRERKGWTIYLAGIVIVILLLAAWFAYTDFMAGNTPAEQPAEAEMPQELPGSVPEQPPIQPLPQIPVPETLPMPGQESSQPESANPSAAAPASTEATAAATPAAPQAAAAGTATVVVTASQTSWVGVTDRDGKELLGRNVVAGSSQSVSGTPPLKLTLGNATGIQVTYNGNPVDIGPHIRSNVARLSLE